jgi:hypothetical protein
LIPGRNCDAAIVAERYSLPPDSIRLYWHYPGRVMHLLNTYGRELWRFVRLGNAVTKQAERKSEIANWLAPFRPITTDPMEPGGPSGSKGYPIRSGQE